MTDRTGCASVSLRASGSDMRRVAVGFFDGIHLGHQSILRSADVALTFRNHPLALLRPEQAPRLMMSLRERLEGIRACGIREVVALDFTLELANLTPEAFAERFWGPLPCTVRCGDNWRFGRGGKGDAALLRSLGYGVEVVPYATHKGEPISSTRVRAALEAGALEDVTAMLGRPFAVSGDVFPGKGLGREIGYPTVNVRTEMALRLPLGVYAVEINGFPAIANYGHAPTLGHQAWPAPVWEVHCLASTSFCLSGGVQTFSLLRFLRSERKFASVRELQDQIARDCAEARALGHLF